jgi:predicted RNA-binding protein with PUA-like domain
MARSKAKAGSAPAKRGARTASSSGGASAAGEAEGPRGWLVKSEPSVYSWEQFVRDGSTRWDGVRNHEARANLAAMRAGELALFYHSNEGKEIAGIARVSRTAYPDPSAEDPRWLAVDLEPVCALAARVTLAAMKAAPALAELALLRRSRLSVVPVSPAHFAHILSLAKTALPAAGRRARR